MLKIPLLITFMLCASYTYGWNFVIKEYSDAGSILVKEQTVYGDLNQPVESTTLEIFEAAGPLLSQVIYEAIKHLARPLQDGFIELLSNNPKLGSAILFTAKNSISAVFSKRSLRHRYEISIY